MMTIAPNTYDPVSSGKNASRLPRMRSASFAASFGNRTASSCPLRAPSPSATGSSVRLIPSSPPMPLSVNPKPSWIGVKLAVTLTSIENRSWAWAATHAPTAARARNSRTTVRAPIRPNSSPITAKMKSVQA